MAKPVYICIRYEEYAGDEIIAVYETEKEARAALASYMEEHGCKNGSSVSYEVRGYRVRNYDFRI